MALGNLYDWGFLVTLGDCHHLYNLVDRGLRREARKKLVRCFGEELCGGQCARSVGATKSNSSRARREGRQVVRAGQVLELVVSTPRERV